MIQVQLKKRMSKNRFCESYLYCTSTIMDKPDEFITGFGHSSSVKQAEAVVKTTLQAAILLILFYCTSHVLYNMVALFSKN